MQTPPLPANGGATSVPASEHVIFQTEDKPLRFQGWLLGASDIVSRDREGWPTLTRARLYRTVGGKLVWATQRISGLVDPQVEPERDRIEHAAASVHGSASEAWDNRPSHNAKVVQAVTQVWHVAAEREPAVRDLLYEDVD